MADAIQTEIRIEENAAQLAGVMLREKEVPTFCHELLKTLHEAARGSRLTGRTT